MVGVRRPRRISGGRAPRFTRLACDRALGARRCGAAGSADRRARPPRIWQGGQDDVHTPAMARWLHDNNASSRLDLRADFATFDCFDVIDEILDELISPA
jgi:hypothetical protein